MATGNVGKVRSRTDCRSTPKGSGAGLPYQAALPPLSIGFVSVIGVALIAPISSYVAPVGARLAHALARRRLEISFGLFLLVASARFVISLLAPTE